MKEKLSVLVVCTGNICRSPMAEGVLRHRAERRGMGARLVVRSAGTHDYHVGECPDPRALKHAHKRGYDLSRQRAMRVEPHHFLEYDYILAMDRSHMRLLREIAPEGATARLGMFLQVSRQWKDADVPDPYYGSPEGFERVLDMVEEAAEQWLDLFEAELDPASFRLKGQR